MSELKAITSVFNIEIEKIDPNPDQPRKHFSQESLNDLAESIRRYGVMQPITVVRRESQTPDGGITTRYEIIAGERRWRASIVAGMASIPAIVREAEETEQERFELSILENLQREDLNPVDKARSFARLADEFGMKHAEIADKLGKSREYVTNALRLLVLPENVLDGLSNGEISEGHTRPLLTLKDKPDELQVLFNEIKAKGLTVRDAEKTARELSGGGRKANRYNSGQPMLDPEMESLQQELAKSLGTTVSIDKKDKGGKLMIDFFSRDDLKKLLSMVGASGMADAVAMGNVSEYDKSTISDQTVVHQQTGQSGIQAETEQEIHKPEVHTTQATDDYNNADDSNQTIEHVVSEGSEVKVNPSDSDHTPAGSEQQSQTDETSPKEDTGEYDEPVIVNEYIVPKEELNTNSELDTPLGDIFGTQEDKDIEQSTPEVERISTTDTVDLVGSTSELISTTVNSTTDTANSVKFNDGFTITPQARDTVLDESLAHRDIITQSAHATESKDRGIGNTTSDNQNTQVSSGGRAAEIQAEIDALAGSVTPETEEQLNGQAVIQTNEAKQLDLGEMDLHEPEFRKTEPEAVINTEPREDYVLSGPERSGSGAIIDSVFGSSEDFVPKKEEGEINYDAVSVAGSDFNPNSTQIDTPVQNNNQTSQVTAEATMGGLGGGNLSGNSHNGPGVTDKYPQGDPYRLDNFSL